VNAHAEEHGSRGDPVGALRLPQSLSTCRAMTDPWAPPPQRPAQPWTNVPPSTSPQPWAAQPWTSTPPSTSPPPWIAPQPGLTGPPPPGQPQIWGPPPPKPRHTGLIVGSCIGLVVALLVGVTAVRAFLAVSNERHIAGSPGYSTFTGPAGKPFPVGRPWGKVCQPIRFTVEEHVPDDVYAQVVSVVNGARAYGLDVTLEDRSFMWHLDSLYYPPGTTSADVQRVGIFVNNGPAPLLSNGKPEHVDLGYDTSRDPDGQHEDMIDAQGTLQMATLTGDPAGQRRAVRYIIALTQGVSGSNLRFSGLRNGSTQDNFSLADLAAMKHMSGCADAPAAVVEHIPT
jgi:hypothetical protein